MGRTFGPMVCSCGSVEMGTNIRSSTLVVALAYLALVGCTTMTPEEAEWAEHHDRLNWELCQLAYRSSHVRMAYSDHMHGKHRKHRWHDVKSDLAENNCKRVLGKYWAE